MTLARASGNGEGLESVLPQLEAVLQFTQELNRRLAGVGIDGISGALELYRRLKGTLDAIPDADLERTLEEVHALGRVLSGMATSLDEVRRLKTLVRSE